MKKIIYLLLFVLPVAVFASSEHSETTDIIPRTINFLIFAGILYYLAANQIMDFFKNRKNSISDRLNSIEEKLKASNIEKIEAKELINKAQNETKNIFEVSENETKILKEKVLENLRSDLENLRNGFDDQASIEERKMRRAVISELLDDVFAEKSLDLKKDELLDIVMKKVA